MNTILKFVMILMWFDVDPNMNFIFKLHSKAINTEHFNMYVFSFYILLVYFSYI